MNRNDKPGLTGTPGDTSASANDWRNVRNASLIYTHGYCDQPYVVVMKDGTWLCVFTTNAGHEGTGGQHIVSSVSTDQGKTWSEPVRIEEPRKASASWAMPYLTNYGRVYVFYIFNGDEVFELRGEEIREDMLGWYCFKYTDDGGKNWSDRHRLDVRLTEADRKNDWGGEVRIMWGIGKPVSVDKGMMFAFTKIKQYMLDYSEGWFFRCDNIHTERDPGKLEWELLPESDHGLKNEDLGPLNSEQNIFQMNDGSIYCMHRTVSGHPAESYSRDGGKTWTLPQVPRYENGIALKNPRACPRIWKAKNNKYLFWYHHNGGCNFDARNPVWISGGIERDGRIIWGQPEILLYEDDIEIRMSYPDLIEQDGRYWITETNKVDARVHSVPAYFLNTLWSQFNRDFITREGLLGEWAEDELKPDSRLNMASAIRSRNQQGFTIDLRIELTNLSPGQLILQARSDNGKTLEIRTAGYGSVEVVLNDGIRMDAWNSDPGLIPSWGERCLSVSVDNGPRIIQFVVDGTVCNGRDFRQFGWGRYKADLEDFCFDSIQIGQLECDLYRPSGRVTSLRIYQKPLMNTELIGNHQHFFKTKKTQPFQIV